MHLFSDPVDIAASASRTQASKAAGAARKPSLSELVQRIESLEADVAKLMRRCEIVSIRYTVAGMQ